MASTSASVNAVAQRSTTWTASFSALVLALALPQPNEHGAAPSQRQDSKIRKEATTTRSPSSAPPSTTGLQICLRI